ncbi:MAG: DUF2271 domain-containing protein [Melioribacteraceae bacterium]|nr:DUF2271 domain-containing protein [Melioribacteraceae bacterium]
MFLLNTNAQQKTESVSFKIRTTSPGGNFSPRNIGAIWVEDASGNFVKTLQIWADRRIQYLYTWNNRSNSNKVDALTSATLSSHQTHNVTWNVKDHLGNNIPDGQYVLKIEMTDQHAQGPLASFNFPIGEATKTSLFPDETYFHDIELSWVSILTDVNDEKTIPEKFQLDQNYPNPFNPNTSISYSLPASEKSEPSIVKLSVYDILGNEVAVLVNEKQNPGNYNIVFSASHLNSGIYFYTLHTSNFSQTKKMILLK